MSVAANRYAKALIDALYPDQAEVGYEQLVQLKKLLKEQPEARGLFENPTVPADRRKTWLREIGKASGFIPKIENFIDVLIERNRLDLLEEITQTYEKLLDERLGIARAVVRAAQPLNEAQQKNLATKLGVATGKQVRMQVSVDPTLLGGMVAQVGGTIYDGSLRQQLQAFKAKLAQE